MATWKQGVSVGILIGVESFLNPDGSKLSLESNNVTVVDSFAHLFLGQDGHGGELLLMGDDGALFLVGEGCFLVAPPFLLVAAVARGKMAADAKNGMMVQLLVGNSQCGKL